MAVYNFMKLIAGVKLDFVTLINIYVSLLEDF